MNITSEQPYSSTNTLVTSCVSCDSELAPMRVASPSPMSRDTYVTPANREYTNTRLMRFSRAMEMHDIIMTMENRVKPKLPTNRMSTR